MIVPNWVMCAYTIPLHLWNYWAKNAGEIFKVWLGILHLQRDRNSVDITCLSQWINGHPRRYSFQSNYKIQDWSSIGLLEPTAVLNKTHQALSPARKWKLTYVEFHLQLLHLQFETSILLNGQGQIITFEDKIRDHNSFRCRFRTNPVFDKLHNNFRLQSWEIKVVGWDKVPKRWSSRRWSWLMRVKKKKKQITWQSRIFDINMWPSLYQHRAFSKQI